MSASIQVLRGLAILLVLLIHVTAFFALEPAPLSALGLLNLWLDVMAHVAVPLFVFISGAVLTLRYVPGAPLAFYRRRLGRLALPYLLFSLAYLAAQGFWQDAPLRLLTADSAYHLWYFLLIAQLYLVYPWLWRLMERHGWGLLPAALLVQLLWEGLYPAAGAWLAERWQGFPAWVLRGWVFDKRFFATHLGYFVLGMLSTRRGLPFLPPVLRLGMALGALVLGLAVAALWAGQIEAQGSWARISPASLVPAHLLAIPLHLLLILLLHAWAGSLRGPALERLGEDSFGIYLLHVFALLWLPGLLAEVSLDHRQGLFYPLLFGLTLGLSWAALRVLRRVPLLRQALS